VDRSVLREIRRASVKPDRGRFSLDDFHVHPYPVSTRPTRNDFTGRASFTAAREAAIDSFQRSAL
jgi:hypothetical protein